DKGGVTLITMHNTKGLEYERVFCVGLEQEIIPGRNALEAKEKEEERRILYVAMTRAKKNLYLSYATERLMWGKMQYQSPSSFLFEIPEKMLSGDTELLYKRNRASSSASYSLGTYKSNYTSSWKSAPISPILPPGQRTLRASRRKRVKRRRRRRLWNTLCLTL
ncbi:MAG: ATP-dependent helicase, partial [Sphaerochaetaceae bacterium]|nr:ATP-dependent helicase [Sphaerochaetaceae bacterium]